MSKISTFVNICAKSSQSRLEERMAGQGKTASSVSGQRNAFARLCKMLRIPRAARWISTVSWLSTWLT